MSYFGLLARRFAPWTLMILLSVDLKPYAIAQVSSASLTLAIADSSGAVVHEAEVVVRNVDTNQEQNSTSNTSGGTTFPFLKPGVYSVVVSKPGFSDVAVNNIRLNVGDQKQLNLVLKIGSAETSVTVDGSGLTINTTDGSVSTVINRQFVANIPLNGRSFQDLISMTPGVVTQSPQATYATTGNRGDFSINGQRTEDNYYTVDGVSGNVTAGSSAGNGYAGSGTVAATSALGTTQSLLSVDALQEFRVESSSYSAEYGRSPGGQLSFATRSGTNTLHGSVFDYFRNGALDANNWFNDHLGQLKNQIHQNDFGGTLGGPVWIPGLYQGQNKTFFFGSYEGLRMTLPVAASIQYVPDVYLRQQAPAVIQPLLNAFPIQSPNGVDYGTNASPSLAQFYQAYSVPGQIDSTSVRVDHTFSPALSGFFRFADTPSSTQSRSLSSVTTGNVNVQTYTLGLTYVFAPTATNQFRLGYSRSFSGSTSVIDGFGGAAPIDLGSPMGFASGTGGRDFNAEMSLSFSGAGTSILQMPTGKGQQRQWNLTDTLEISQGKQHWKFGVDFRTFTTLQEFSPVEAVGSFATAQSVLSNAGTTEYLRFAPSKPVYNQVALFAQDDWRITSRLSLSAGLRWELAPPPHNSLNPQPYTVIGMIANPSTLALAPNGTPMWHTSWYNFAPRLGLAWQAHNVDAWATVVRLGGGVFFGTNSLVADTAFSGLGTFALGFYPSSPLPFTSAQQNVPFTVVSPYSSFTVLPSHLQLPYTLGWNASIEQELGNGNAATISYVGSAARRLSIAQQINLSKATSNLFGTITYPLGVTSDYDSLQAKFQRSISRGINALVAYTWSHSIDYGSNFTALTVTRGNSDFDLRNNVQAGVTWELPKVKSSTLVSPALNGWRLDGRILARTSFPITLQGNLLTDPVTGTRYYANLNLIPDQPIYLHGSRYPGGRSLNPAAFAVASGNDPGSAPRNFARGFGASQVNVAVTREFRLYERAHLQFRGEAFNISNHPNFGYIDPTRTDPTFGQALQTLNQSLATVASQYQQGGPRSVQLALRLSF